MNAADFTARGMSRRLDEELNSVGRRAGPPASASANHALFTDLFGTPARGRIWLDRAEYDVGSNTLFWSLSNVWVKGAPGGSTIKTSARTLLFMQASTDCVFEDLNFVVTAADAASSTGDAALRSLNVLLQRHRFIRCKFSCTDANQNAIKMVADENSGTGAILESLHFHECIIDGAGRMGVELQNHDPNETGDTTQRILDFRWEGGCVRNTGLIASGGQGVSLSGYGSDNKIDTLFDNVSLAAIENVGSSNSRFSGRLRNCTRSCSPIAMTNNNPMENNTVEDFKCMDTANGKVTFWNQKNLHLRGNIFDLQENVEFRGCIGMRSQGEYYKTRGRFGFFAQDFVDSDPAAYDALTGCRWDGLEIDMRDAPNAYAYALCRFSAQPGGSGVSGNIVNGATFWQAPGPGGSGVNGAVLDNKNGAVDNYLTGAPLLNGTRLQRVIHNLTSDADAALDEYYFFGDVLKITSNVSLTTARQITVPSEVPVAKTVNNATNGGQDLVLRNSAGTMATIPNGESRLVVFKGGANGLEAY